MKRRGFLGALAALAAAPPAWAKSESGRIVYRIKDGAMFGDVCGLGSAATDDHRHEARAKIAARIPADATNIEWIHLRCGENRQRGQEYIGAKWKEHTLRRGVWYPRECSVTPPLSAGEYQEEYFRDVSCPFGGWQFMVPA